jgi:hypothetical protein
MFNFSTTLIFPSKEDQSVCMYSSVADPKISKKGGRG